MIDLISIIKSVVQAEIAGHPTTEFAIVDAVRYPDAAGQENYACDVRLRGHEAVLENVPLATPYAGLVTPPIVGDMVVLAYLGGDPDHAVITSVVHSDTVRPPEVAEGQSLMLLPHDGAEGDRVDTRITAGSNGTREWLLDLPDGPSVRVTDTAITATSDAFELVLDMDAGTAVLTAGEATLTLDDKGNATLEGSADLTLEAQGNLAMSAGGNVTLEAGGTMALQAAKIDLN